MNQYVSDLAWIVTSKRDWQGKCRDQNLIESDVSLSQYWLPDVSERLSALVKAPAPLERAIHACKSHFLGSYFETLFSFAIAHFSSLKVVAEHEQVIQDGKTLGEVDMLVETPAGELIQFEVAIKFYLERLDLYPDHWVGPNKNDSLRKKVTRARSHQLQILQTQPGKDLLHSFAFGREASASLLIFGRLYLALNQPSKISKLCDTVGFGGWLALSNVASLFPHFSHVVELTKPHWLTNPNMTRDSSLFTAQCIYKWRDLFLKDARPLHICLWSESKGSMSSRFIFVVPDNW